MKKRISIFLISLMLLSACASKQATPQGTVEKFLSSAKGSNVIGITQSIEPFETDESTDNEGSIWEDFEMNVENLDEKGQEIYEVISEHLKELTYTITDETIDGDSASVLVDITHRDASPVMMLSIIEMVPMFLEADEEPTNEDFNQVFFEVMAKNIKNYEAQLKDVTVTVSLVKLNNKWYIESENYELFDTVLSGLVLPLVNLNETFE